MAVYKHIHAWLDRQYSVAGTVRCITQKDMSQLKPDKGAYVLLFHLPDGLTLDHHQKRTWLLHPGHYLYIGSARGPGGLAARVGRHLSGSGKAHWHIDDITQQKLPACAYVILDGDECDLVDMVERDFGAISPIPGFGSSDCRRCRSHLLKLPEIDATRESD